MGWGWSFSTANLKDWYVYIYIYKLKYASHESIGYWRMSAIPSVGLVYLPTNKCRQICQSHGWSGMGQQTSTNLRCGFQSCSFHSSSKWSLFRVHVKLRKCIPTWRSGGTFLCFLFSNGFCFAIGWDCFIESLPTKSSTDLVNLVTSHHPHHHPHGNHSHHVIHPDSIQKYDRPPVQPNPSYHFFLYESHPSFPSFPLFHPYPYNPTNPHPNRFTDIIQPRYHPTGNSHPLLLRPNLTGTFNKPSELCVSRFPSDSGPKPAAPTAKIPLSLETLRF